MTSDTPRVRDAYGIFLHAKPGLRNQHLWLTTTGKTYLEQYYEKFGYSQTLRFCILMLSTTQWVESISETDMFTSQFEKKSVAYASMYHVYMAAVYFKDQGIN